MSEDRIFYLLKAYTGHTSTEAEEQELFHLVGSADHDAILKEHINHLIQSYKDEKFPGVNWENIYQNIVEGARQCESIAPIRHLRWYQIAAAGVILLMGMSVLLLHKRQASTINAVATKASVFKNDIRPGTTKAILRAGGVQVTLDKRDTSFTLAGNKVSISSGNVKISNIKPVAYTLITPIGGTYNLILPDGTKVWLNAGSKLIYPSVFNGNAREVALTGEAYFDVKTDGDHPFVVKTDEQNIKVLGTEFNICAYPDEAHVITTLVMGKVQVNTADKQLVLKPGQQVESDQAGQISLNPDADVEQAIAWKNGYFRFDKADIHTIMTQLARWYNIKVTYESKINGHYFGAIMNRNNNISQILNMLSATGEVHFAIDGKDVTVMQ